MKEKLQRRTVLSALGGALSISMVAPGERLAEPYRVHKKTIRTDILVVGGGTAGVVAALQAARAGKKTILVENGSQLGGTTTTGGVAFPGIFFAWGKQVIGGIGWEMVQEAVALNDDTLPNFSIPHGRNHPRHQVRLNGQLYALLLEEKCTDAGVQLRFYETPTKASFRNNTWTVETMGKGTQTEIVCQQLIDCTGNAFVTALAGFDVLRETVTQPGTLMFRIGGYDLSSLDLPLIQSRYQDAIRRGELVKSDFRNNIAGLLRSEGDNIQHVLGADSTTSETHTLANIAGRASLLKTLRFLRTLPGLEKTKIIDVQNETAVRETYRIDGHYQITHQDYVTGRVFDDALSYSYYPIDVHDENGVVPDHLKEGVVPTIPLRSLIPKRSRNFLVAGRCVSSDRLANSALRVQASCMGMGQAAAAAAVLACDRKTTPLEVPHSAIKKLLREHGAIVPGA
ncbi:FAD-dependent oxidoreductase [Siphonobacter aquaeclarae]|uniref:FAD dependent oxidoreductase n=1 Tax=Siphonobacter aquaeclarae TaxID=563176 RepID=A0A1G9HPP9_9BACT|nr:FAD-dependent oxidoreductase [Siphonobacter aquaeclarae]SDL14825.1 FAD dependent oxidoreductase [Siphonobacter aquaeclarae]